MKYDLTLRSTLAGLVMAGAFGLVQAQTPNQATAPTVAQTVKPPPMVANDKMKPTTAESATSPAVAQTVKPGTGMAPTSPATTSATSPTVAQTVKPAPNTRKAKRMKKPVAKVDPADLGSGSSGTTPGRVAGSTNSNSKGDAPKP